jgi:hypothetical protein
MVVSVSTISEEAVNARPALDSRSRTTLSRSAEMSSERTASFFPESPMIKPRVGGEISEGYPVEVRDGYSSS